MKCRAILGVVSALALDGCALESGETGNDEPGEAVDGLGSYWGDINSSNDQLVGHPFPVPSDGAVTVEAWVKWTPKPGYNCFAPAVTLVLTKRSPPAEQIGGRSFFPKAPKKKETWSGLAAGTYDLIVQTNNDNPGCVLTGHVDITVRP